MRENLTWPIYQPIEEFPEEYQCGYNHNEDDGCGSRVRHVVFEYEILVKFYSCCVDDDALGEKPAFVGEVSGVS